MQITGGRIRKAIKTVIYGPEGIGKSTFAAQFPGAVFIDTEGSTDHMDVRRLPKPMSWAELLNEIDWVSRNPQEVGTLVLDTADWAEVMCISSICAQYKKSGIEEFGYGKGYTYVGEEFGRLLNALEKVIEKGINVVVTAHAKMRKFEQPDEMGAYDRWEMKLSKQAAPLLKEWADMVLFASYKTTVINVDGQGAAKGKNKAAGGQRVIRTTHHPSWDAKNRFGLPEEAPFEFGVIAHIIPTDLNPALHAAPPVEREPVRSEPVQTGMEPPAPVREELPGTPASEPQGAPEELVAHMDSLWDGIPEALVRLMKEDDIGPGEVAYAVAQVGYFPADMKVSEYPKDFVDGCLIGAWPQVRAAIMKNRQETPF